MESKYLAVSCLQKSIRQGFPDLAEKYADLLWEAEKGYLLYRLSIIAVEDVGIANWPIITPVLKTAMRKQGIEALGGKAFIMQWVRELALSGKDRTACDWPYLSSHLPVDQISELHIKSRADILDSTETTLLQPLSLWSWLGQKPCANENLAAITTPEPEAFWAWHEQQKLPDGALESIKACSGFQREPMFLALALCEKAKQNETQKELEKSIPDQYVIKNHEPVMLGDWLLSGFDKHTREGGQLLRQWLQKNRQLQTIMNQHRIPYNEQSDFMGRVMFQIDGGQVNKRLIYPTAIKIYKMAQNMWHPEAAKILRNEWKNQWGNWQDWATQQKNLAPEFSIPLPKTNWKSKQTV